MESNFFLPDPEIEVAESMLMESIMIDQYDLMNYLAENGMYTYLDEASGKGGAWYAKWKMNLANNIKTIVAHTVQWAQAQAANDRQFIESNRDVLFNLRQYPPKSTSIAKSAPNYQSAIQRLSTPISTNLRGFDLNKIEDDPKANIAFKKSLIPTYNGSKDQGDFAGFARNYYYGADARRDINVSQMVNVIRMAAQFCSDFNTRITSIQTDANGIMNYINQDPAGVQTSVNNQASDLQKLAAAQYANQMKNAAGQASTNPVANVVNADTSFEYFMEQYFGEDAMVTTKKGNISGNKPVSPVTNKAATDPVVASSQDKKTPNGAPVDATALAMNKKKIACDIVRDCLAAKLAALGMVYRDMMLFMRTHVASYKGPGNANIGNQGGQAQAPQQQVSVPVNTPQPNQ